MLERLDDVRKEALIGQKIDFETIPKDEEANVNVRCQQTKAGVLKQVYVSFYSSKGEICALQMDAGDATPEVVGKALQWAMGDAFRTSWKELKEAPESIRDASTLIHPALDDEPAAAAKELGKEMNKGNMKWVTIKLFKGGSARAIITPWSAMTNDSHAILPEKEEVVEVPEPMDAGRAGILGGAALQRCRLALSREEANLHPGDEYKASRPKWAD